MSETEQLTGLEEGIRRAGTHWPNVRLAHEALMVDKLQRQSRIVESLARNAMTGDYQNLDGWPGNEGDDAMGVKIGDTITNHHYYAPQQPQPAEPAPSQPEPPPGPRVGENRRADSPEVAVEPAVLIESKLSTWQRVLPYLGAAALGTIPPAAMLLYNNARSEKPPPSVQQPPTNYVDTVPSVIVRPHGDDK